MSDEGGARVRELYELATRMQRLTAEWPVEEAPPAPRLLTFEQTAEALAVSHTTVQALVDGGEIPVVRVTGRAVRVDARDVEAFVKRKRERR